VKLPSGAKAVAAGAAKASLLGSDRTGGESSPISSGRSHTYVSDTAAGQVKGQALKLNGGYWYVLSPSGKVIKTKLSGAYP
jgi:hypothetical protein